MKKILLALGLTFAAMSSQAALTFVAGPGTTIATDTKNDILDIEAPTTFTYGKFFAEAGDILTFTNFGGLSEAGFENLFINGAALFANTDGTAVTSYTYTVTTTGALDFYFADATAGFPGYDGIFANGSASIAVLTNVPGFGSQYLLLLDDSADGHDFDDHAVGLSEVPVPAALPLMASALGAFGIARRRSNKAKAV